MVEAIRTFSNLYRLGWDERNGGNLTYLLTDDDVRDYLDTTKVIREIPFDFDGSALIGKMFLVTGTGEYFKNIQYEPEKDLGIIRIGATGRVAELLWGFRGGNKFTSELPSHLMSHISRLSVDPLHRVVIHSHPTYTVAMSLTHALTEREFTRSLWKVQTESIVVFPEGISVLPWMVCGNNEIGAATAKKLTTTRICVWTAHGIYGTGRTLDEAFGLIETVEKAAQLFMLTEGHDRINEISDRQLKELAASFGLNYRKDYLD